MGYSFKIISTKTRFVLLTCLFPLLFSLWPWSLLLTPLLFSSSCPGPGASDGQAADWNVSSSPETHQLRGVYRSSLHTCATSGPSLHLEDGRLQPPHPVSPLALCLLVVELQPIKMQSEPLVGQTLSSSPFRGDEAWCIIMYNKIWDAVSFIKRPAL